VKAKENNKQTIENPSEFFERLDFLVTFLSMKKVTKSPSGNEINPLGQISFPH